MDKTYKDVDITEEVTFEGIKGLTMAQNFKRQLASQYFKIIFSLLVLLPFILFIVYVLFRLNYTLDNGFNICDTRTNICQRVEFIQR